MTRQIFSLIIVSVLLSAVAQIVLKAGMSNPAVLQGLAGEGKWQAIRVVASNPLVVGGLVTYFLSAAVWLLVLARVQVSLAYPFVGLGFIVTMLLGWWIHGDTLGVQKVTGTLLIALGVVILARS